MWDISKYSLLQAPGFRLAKTKGQIWVAHLAFFHKQQWWQRTVEKPLLAQRCSVFGLVPRPDHPHGTGFGLGGCKEGLKTCCWGWCSPLCAKASAESSCANPPEREKEDFCECLGGIQVWILCRYTGRTLPRILRVCVVAVAGSKTTPLLPPNQEHVTSRESLLQC